MQVSAESLLIMLAVGLTAGWLADQIVRGTGFGTVGDLIIGIIGASSAKKTSRGEEPALDGSALFQLPRL